MTKPLCQLYNTNQIKAIEQSAISGGVSGFTLMSRAGEAVVKVLQARWPTAQTVLVLCGAGNNAGDGYIVARLLQQAGLEVLVLALTDDATLTGDALQACQAYQAIAGKILPYNADFCLSHIKVDVIVDALFGTGLSRPVAGCFAAIITMINQSALPVLAVDVPSGINANTGTVMGVAIHAHATVTFIAHKQGLLTGAAPDYCGDIVVDDLGLPVSLLSTVTAAAHLVEPNPLPKRKRCAHKGNNGHVLIIGGDLGYSGSIALAGYAALRVGSGLVSLATQPAHAEYLTIARPELMCHGISEPAQLQPLLAKASVVVIGPGLGQSAWAVALWESVKTITKPLIIDADALNLLAKAQTDIEPSPLWMLTPHPGEAARLLNCDTASIQADRFAAVKALQARYGGTVVLKGAGTLIADATQLAISVTGNPGMASGGMGDVLCGVIAGLCAQGLSIWDAVETAVYIHGKAADWAAAEVGERGLIASDLCPMLQRLVNV